MGPIFRGFFKHGLTKVRENFKLDWSFTEFNAIFSKNGVCLGGTIVIRRFHSDKLNNIVLDGLSSPF